MHDILKIIYQPFVTNFFLHGIKPFSAWGKGSCHRARHLAQSRNKAAPGTNENKRAFPARPPTHK